MIPPAAKVNNVTFDVVQRKSFYPTFPTNNGCLLNQAIIAVLFCFPPASAFTIPLLSNSCDYLKSAMGVKSISTALLLQSSLIRRSCHLVSGSSKQVRQSLFCYQLRICRIAVFVILHSVQTNISFDPTRRQKRLCKNSNSAYAYEEDAC